MKEGQSEVHVEMYSPQLQQKVAPSPADDAPMEARAAAGLAIQRARARPQRPHTDTWFRYNALPNEYIVPIGRGGARPVLGGSVIKLLSRGVLRFPSYVQRVEFKTDNISSENQGVLVAGWAAWRVRDPKLAVEQMDFSDRDDPMGKTSKILAIQCAGIMKGLISIKRVSELLKRREDLIDKLREKLQPTEERWGISFDEIGISEVQVLSQEVFENLQRPFRNEAREVAATSDLETEENITRKTSEQRERVVQIEAESDRRLRALKATAETEIRAVEQEEERKRILGDQAVTDLRLEEEKRVKALQAELDRALAREAAEAEKNTRLARIAAEQEEALRALQAREAEKVRAMELDAEREKAALLVQRAVVKERTLTEKQALESQKEVAEVQAQLEARTREVAAMAAREQAELDHELERGRLAVATEQADLDQKVRAIQSHFTQSQIQMRMVESLPEIAAHLPIGDVRWYGGGEGDPIGLLGRAVDSLLDLAAARGVDLTRPSPPEAP